MKYRLKSGVAASLNYVNLANAQNEASPKLKPYPDWGRSFIKIDSTNTTSQTQPAASTAPITAPTTAVDGSAPPSTAIQQDKAAIISGFQIRVDQCGYLWVLDTGLVDILDNPKQIAPPALVIFDLTSNEVYRRAPFDQNVIRGNSIFANMVNVINLKNSYVRTAVSFYLSFFAQYQ